MKEKYFDKQQLGYFFLLRHGFSLSEQVKSEQFPLSY